MEKPKRSKGTTRKRSENACVRCRQQKIRCTGSFPCQPCSRRALNCNFDDGSKKILVTKSFIKDLQQKARPNASLPANNTGVHTVSLQLNHQSNGDVLAGGELQPISINNTTHINSDEADTIAHATYSDDEDSATPSAHLMNPLAIDAGNYMADPRGRTFHLGKSSNWSFGRRVLQMTCEKLNIPHSTESLHFEGSVYRLDWTQLRVLPDSQSCQLPSADHVMFLISAVKFHCGQMFHMFDDESFMQQLRVFQESHGDVTRVQPLWYIHYLLVIAFGKAFTATKIQGSRPPGVDLFFEAMRRLPEITFFWDDPVQSTEILICAALYLQCLDFRSTAYNLIGQALRKAMEIGMHTKMASQHLSDSMVQRCRKAWWTVYILDRQMSSLMGLPVSIRDEDISAPLCVFPESFQRTIGLEIHVKLSRVITDILNTVYGTEGRIARTYLSSTKQALKNIANVTNLLKQHLELPDPQAMTETPRLAAYLHLLHYQCICLTTRPLVYTFLERRLKSRRMHSKHSQPADSICALLKTCVEAAQQILAILAGLQSQGLLESFLPFDLEAVFIAAMILIMMSVVDPSYLDERHTWSETVYSLLDEFASRGNMIAVYRKQELQQLSDVLTQVPTQDIGRNEQVPVQLGGAQTHSFFGPSDHPPMMDMQYNELLENPIWQEELCAEQLNLLADTLDLDGLDWMASSQGEPSVHSANLSIDT